MIRNAVILTALLLVGCTGTMLGERPENFFGKIAEGSFGVNHAPSSTIHVVFPDYSEPLPDGFVFVPGSGVVPIVRGWP